MSIGGIKANLQDLKKLQGKLNKINEAAMEEFVAACAKELMARLLAMVKRRTPTVTGNLKLNWSIGEIRKTANGYEIVLLNNTEYASYVEKGHRTVNHRGWVPGKFMLAISEQQLKALAPAILEKKIERQIRGWFSC